MGRKNIDDMNQEELAKNWEKAKALLELLTSDEMSKFKDGGEVMWGLIERLVAEGVDLKTWEPSDERNDLIEV